VSNVCEDGMGRILFYGNLCIDNVLDVKAYPKENTIQRAAAARKAIGGNGGNSTRVLKQLQGTRSCVSWLGPVAKMDESETMFALAALRSAGVDTTLAEEVGGDSFPTSVIISSQLTGTRTIVSTRNGVRELGLPHFTASVKRAFANAAQCGRPSWCHLECRQSPDIMMQLAKAWRDGANSRPVMAWLADPWHDAAGRSRNGESSVPPLSVEVEKPTLDLKELLPLLQVCDYVFFSQDFAEANHDKVVALSAHLEESNEEPGTKRQKTGPPENSRAWEQHIAVSFMRAMSKCVRSDATWICAWGEYGAFGLSTSTGCIHFEPAHAQREVLDSVGAGDTFIAASIHAFLLTSDVQRALNCACAVAGRKVAQVGFASLADALPSGMH